MSSRTSSPPDVLERLVADARAVLDANWLGASTLPSRTLYPHQWNWDSAFMAVAKHAGKYRRLASGARPALVNNGNAPDSGSGD